jgi:hypothetical protein
MGRRVGQMKEAEPSMAASKEVDSLLEYNEWLHKNSLDVPMKLDRFPNGIKNESGQVAVQYYQTIPKSVKVRKSEYFFTVKHNVCLAWVNEEDVFSVLAIPGGCCGNHKPGVFRLASQINVHLWATGER